MLLSNSFILCSKLSYPSNYFGVSRKLVLERRLELNMAAISSIFYFREMSLKF